MRLINTSTLELKEFVKDIPSYAILSHRWTDDEISYKDFLKGRRIGSVGYKKVLRFCDFVRQRTDSKVEDAIPTSRERILAWEQPVQWAWVDTCCIDKRSSAELSEAINSMWSWYSEALYCVVHLADVPGSSNTTDQTTSQAFRKSDWLNRGWTLQELLAPQNIIFCSSDWERLGIKIDPSILRMIEERTGIEQCYLTGNAREACAAKKLSWASQRQTTRDEDMAYCLLGLLNVHMSLLYGEGLSNAFRRLQIKFIARSDDESIFAWPSNFPFDGLEAWKALKPVLADNPSYFHGARHMENIKKGHSDYTFKTLYHTTSKGLMLETRARKVKVVFRDDDELAPARSRLWSRSDDTLFLVALNCRDMSSSDKERYVIALKRKSDWTFRVIGGSRRYGTWDLNALWKQGRTTNMRFLLRLSVL